MGVQVEQFLAAYALKLLMLCAAAAFTGIAEHSSPQYALLPRSAQSALTLQATAPGCDISFCRKVS